MGCCNAAGTKERRRPASEAAHSKAAQHSSMSLQASRSGKFTSHHGGIVWDHKTLDAHLLYYIHRSMTPIHPTMHISAPGKRKLATWPFDHHLLKLHPLGSLLPVSPATSPPSRAILGHITRMELRRQTVASRACLPCCTKSTKKPEQHSPDCTAPWHFNACDPTPHSSMALEPSGFEASDLPSLCNAMQCKLSQLPWL